MNLWKERIWSLVENAGLLPEIAWRDDKEKDKEETWYAQNEEDYDYLDEEPTDLDSNKILIYLNNMNLGYACINTVLKENNIFTNRTMRRKTFDAKGLDYVSDLSLQNVKDLKTHILWNNEHDIKLFRLSSQIFPWMEEYEFSDLKGF